VRLAFTRRLVAAGDASIRPTPNRASGGRRHLVDDVSMPLLFSYGTLQQEDVQLATFGRRLGGQADALVGFEPSSVRIEDPRVAATLGKTHHANVKFNGRDESRVPGSVFEVTDAELAVRGDVHPRPPA
jgi:hypothetical protein